MLIRTSWARLVFDFSLTLATPLSPFLLESFVFFSLDERARARQDNEAAACAQLASDYVFRKNSSLGAPHAGKIIPSTCTPTRQFILGMSSGSWNELQIVFLSSLPFYVIASKFFIFKICQDRGIYK